MKQFFQNPRPLRASAILIEGAALFGLFVLASMIAVIPVALRFMSAG